MVPGCVASSHPRRPAAPSVTTRPLARTMVSRRDARSREFIELWMSEESIEPFPDVPLDLLACGVSQDLLRVDRERRAIRRSGDPEWHLPLAVVVLRARDLRDGCDHPRARLAREHRRARHVDGAGRGDRALRSDRELSGP